MNHADMDRIRPNARLVFLIARSLIYGKEVLQSRAAEDKKITA